MPLKKSCFNRTLFQKNLNRFWPLWGGVSLVGAMFPLYLLLSLIEGQSLHIASGDFARGLYQAAAGAVPVMTFLYALLCAMAVWGYLYDGRAVGLMHTLPVDRTCLFVTNTLSGLAMIVIPYAVVGAFLCLIAIGWGFFDLMAVAVTVLAVLFMTALFFGMATLCAMLTGHIFILPAFYLLVNFLSMILESLTKNMSRQFLLGISAREDDLLTVLSPLVQILRSTGIETVLDRPRLRGFGTMAVYALAGLVMIGAAWLLYRRRRSECAGDVVAFRWLRPVFRYGIALLSGLSLGQLLYALLWGGLFQRGRYADAIPMWVCVAATGVVGYYAASMLLEKSLRVFHKESLKGLGIVCVGAAALCLLVGVDLFGVERRVPALDEIASVTLENRGETFGSFSPEEHPEVVEQIRAFHQAVIDDKDYVRNYKPEADDADEEERIVFYNVWLDYSLKDGTRLYRSYPLWLTAGRINTAGTYDAILAAIYQDPTVRRSLVEIPEGSTLENIDVYSSIGDYGGYIGASAYGETDHTAALYAALQRDCAEGNLPVGNVMLPTRVYRGIWLQVQTRRLIQEMGNAAYYTSDYKQVYLSPAMEHTVGALVELGYFTEEEIAVWEDQFE